MVKKCASKHILCDYEKQTVQWKVLAQQSCMALHLSIMYTYIVMENTENQYSWLVYVYPR